MKQFTFDNHWDAIKGQLKQRYGQLTDDDLTFAEGKGEELLARLRDRLGMSSPELNRMLNEMHTEIGGRFEQAKAAAGKMAEDLRAKAGVVADDVKAKATAAADEVKVQAGIAYDQARQRARTLREDGEEYVRKNPRESLVAALFAGFIAGLLIRR